MKNDKSLKILVIATLVVTVAGLSIAYATLSQTLNISGTVTAKGATWALAFSSPSSCTTTGTATVTTQPAVVGTSVNFDASIIKPGDSVTCTFMAKNTGTIDAKLASVSNNLVSYEGTVDDKAIVENAIVINPSYSGLAINDIIAAGASKKITATVTYAQAATQVPVSAVTINIPITYNFVQA
ncbi:MAG: hypothetical protein RR847_00430 [Bacilli bacterium]